MEPKGRQDNRSEYTDHRTSTTLKKGDRKEDSPQTDPIGSPDPFCVVQRVWRPTVPPLTVRPTSRDWQSFCSAGNKTPKVVPSEIKRVGWKTGPHLRSSVAHPHDRLCHRSCDWKVNRRQITRNYWDSVLGKTPGGSVGLKWWRHRGRTVSDRTLKDKSKLVLGTTRGHYTTLESKLLPSSREVR